MLSCFVKKVSDVAILRFLMAFFGNFGILFNFLAFFCTILVFWAFYTVLSQLQFVINYAYFRVNYFWLKPCLCKKSCLFASLCKSQNTWKPFFYFPIINHVCLVVPPEVLVIFNNPANYLDFLREGLNKKGKLSSFCGCGLALGGGGGHRMWIKNSLL